MKRIVSLCMLTLLVGCGRQHPSLSVLVVESVPLSEEHVEAVSLPRYIPDGTQHTLPAVGFEASDGSFYPVVALCKPVPRGGSVEPIVLEDRQLKVYRGTDPIATNNELLGVYEIDAIERELQIGFSVTLDGRLELAIADSLSGESLAVRPLSVVTTAKGMGLDTSASRNSSLAQNVLEWIDVSAMSRVLSWGTTRCATRFTQ